MAVESIPESILWSTKMRSIIKYQMGLLDTRFKGKNIPTFKIKEQYAEKEKDSDNG